MAKTDKDPKDKSKIKPASSKDLQRAKSILPKPASGRVEPTFDRAFWRYASGGPGGFGVRQSGGSINLSKSPPPAPRGGNMPDPSEQKANKQTALMAKKITPMPKVRKAKK